MSSPSPSDDAIFDVPAEGEGSLEVWLRLAPARPSARPMGAFTPGCRSATGMRFMGSNRPHSVTGHRWLLVDHGELSGDWAIRRVLDALEPARGSMAARRRSSFASAPDNAGSRDQSSSYLDLGDPSGWAIKIGAEGWSVVNRPDVHFRRLQGLLGLPCPAARLDRTAPFLCQPQRVRLPAADRLARGGTGRLALIRSLCSTRGLARQRARSPRIVRLLIDPWSPHCWPSSRKSPRPDVHRRQRLGPGTPTVLIQGAQ